MLLCRVRKDPEFRIVLDLFGIPDRICKIPKAIYRPVMIQNCIIDCHRYEEVTCTTNSHWVPESRGMPLYSR